MTTIAIIDYGVGNLRSLEKAFAHVGVEAVVSADAEVLARADRIVLPGVGAFGAAMSELRARGFDRLVHAAVAAGTPVLGVCVGFQMLFTEGHEFGVHPGLGLLPGKVVRCPRGPLPVPQVGWNEVAQTRPHPLFDGIADNAFFYFVHSYYVEAEHPADVLGTTDYGFTYPTVCARGNVMGIQCHPEKSQTVGLRLLKNFAELSA